MAKFSWVYWKLEYGSLLDVALNRIKVAMKHLNSLHVVKCHRVGYPALAVRAASRCK